MSAIKESEYARLATIFNAMGAALPAHDVQFVYDLIDRVIEGYAEAAISLADPLPVLVSDSLPGLLLGVAENSALVADSSGNLAWYHLAHLQVKYPPDSPYRLRLGWAEKGNR